MMGFCGLECAACPAYLGTVRSDLELLERTARDWSNANRSYSVTEMACLGCMEPDDRLVSAYCASCEVRRCALESEVRHCVLCPEFDRCQRMARLLEQLGKPTLARKLDLLRKKVVGGRTSVS